MNWIQFFVVNRKFTLVLTLFLVIYGLGGLIQMNSEQFPAVNIGAANITTFYPGASAEDIEAKITTPIEDEVRSVSGLKEVRSISQPGISKISIYIDIDNYDVEDVTTKLQRAVDRVSDLPVDLPTPPHFLEIKSEEFPVMEIAVVGANTGRLRNRVADSLKDELEDNRNVSGVQLIGYSDRQFNIELDRSKLARLHVGVNEVTDRLRRQNITVPAGNLENLDSLKLIKVEGKLKSTSELENMVVRSNFSGERVLLKDVAEIHDAEEDPETIALYNGEPATLLVVTKKGGADIIDLSKAATAIVRDFEAKYGGQLQFKTYLNEGSKVERRIGILKNNGLSGLVLVVALLLAFLPGRIGLMSAISLPLAVFGTVGFMLSYGLTLNTITILALVISLGMLVDNSVVISENYTRLRSEGFGRRGAAVKTVADLWLPITATALTTIAAFLPMLVTKGIIGQFIIGIPIVVTAALLISLVEGFFLLPMRLVVVDKVGLSRVKGSQSGDWFDRLFVERFSRLARNVVRHRYWAALIFTAVLIGSLVLMTVGNKFVLFPADQTEIYVARLEMPRGTRIETTTSRLNELISKIKEKLGSDAEHIAVTTGNSQADHGDPKARRGENVGLLRVFVSAHARDERTTNEVLSVLRQIQVEGAQDLSFEALINGPPIGDPVTVVFRSNNEGHLLTAVDEVRQQLSAVPGLTNLRVDDVINEDEVRVDVDIVKAGRLGLDLDTVGGVIRAAMAGIDVSDVSLNNKKVDYFVRLQDKDRLSVASLEELTVMNRSGNLIPLRQFAEFKKEDGRPQIKRFDFKRAKTITAGVDDSVITAVEANKKVAEIFSGLQEKYKDVSYKFGGEGERIEESMTSLATALVMSVIGIFAILVFLFRSYLRPFVIMTTIPLGIVGVSIAFFLSGRPVSFMAMIGIIGLGGIIVNSGIVLISFIEQLKKEMRGSLEDVLVRAATLRLRAVVVTSVTTVAGLLPTAYGIGGSDEFIVPLTLAMAWGLASGTVLAIIWVPAAYAITEDFAEWLRKFQSTKWTVLRKKAEPKLKEAI